jgi:predicted hydrolase (HD superfamily)
MKLEQAKELLAKYVKGETLTRHCVTVSAAMDYWAKLLKEDDPEFWACVGMLHDIDFEQYPDQHCVKAKDILEAEKANYPVTDEMIHAIQSHGWKICCDVEPTVPMEKVLYTVDELTGLIFACAMARPSKSVMDMELKSVTKKFKTRNFAAGCNRDVIEEGARMMGRELDDVIWNCILAMRAQHEACGV